MLNEPVTTLDARFSDPDTVATEWDETRQVLEKAEIFWITTVRADGRPHITPLVAVWLDGAIHFCTGTTEQKAMNLRGNQHVILMTGCKDWDSGLDVMVEGSAVQVTNNDKLERLAQVWSTKWDGRWHYVVRDGFFYGEDEPVLVFSVKPVKILSFAKGTFSHTRHQF